MKKQLLIFGLIAISCHSAMAQKCYRPNRDRLPRQSEEMIKINNADIQPQGHALVDRKTGNRIFLASLSDDASSEAIGSSCNGVGLTPIFQEKMCSGETNTYIIKSQLCVETFQDYNNGRLIRYADERIEFYPGSLTVWTFNDGLAEKVFLFPWTTIADVLVLPFSTLIAAEDIAYNVIRRHGQRRMERRLHKKDVKISHGAAYDVLRSLMRFY